MNLCWTKCWAATGWIISPGLLCERENIQQAGGQGKRKLSLTGSCYHVNTSQLTQEMSIALLGLSTRTQYAHKPWCRGQQENSLSPHNLFKIRMCCIPLQNHYARFWTWKLLVLIRFARPITSVQYPSNSILLFILVVLQGSRPEDVRANFGARPPAV